MIRDDISKALINNDVEGLNKYKMERERVRKIEQLSKEVSEIKSVLNLICEKISRIERI